MCRCKKSWKLLVLIALVSSFIFCTEVCAQNQEMKAVKAEQKEEMKAVKEEIKCENKAVKAE